MSISACDQGLHRQDCTCYLGVRVLRMGQSPFPVKWESGRVMFYVEKFGRRLYIERLDSSPSRSRFERYWQDGELFVQLGTFHIIFTPKGWGLTHYEDEYLYQGGKPEERYDFDEGGRNLQLDEGSVHRLEGGRGVP